MGTSGGNRSLMNPYFMNPLIDPNMLSALLTSGLGSNMMDSLSAMNYLNQVGYQDILRHYQTNLSSLNNFASGLNNTGITMTNISNAPTMNTSVSSANTSTSINNSNNMTVQQLLNLKNPTTSASQSAPMYHQATTKTTTTMSMTKDRPNISITPVNTSLLQLSHKTKLSKPSSQTEPLPVHIPKSLQITPATKPVLHSSTAQVSLLKPSVIQQVKTNSSKQMSAPQISAPQISAPQISTPQIRVSKSLTEPQPAHNSSLPHSPLKNSGVSNSATVTCMPQVAHTTVGASVMKQGLPMNLPASRSGTSLQHKLLSKKNLQRPYSQTNMQNPAKKTKTSKASISALPNSFPNLLNAIPTSSAISQSPFISSDLSSISMNHIPQSTIKITNMKYVNYKKSVKPKTLTAVDTSSSLPTSFSQSSSVEALSMLSQLQQHSHLEIIPQQKTQLKSCADYSKNLSSSLPVVPQKISETLKPPTTDCMSMYDISRGKSANISNKNTDKLTNDSVEIITLDD